MWCNQTSGCLDACQSWSPYPVTEWGRDRWAGHTPWGNCTAFVGEKTCYASCGSGRVPYFWISTKRGVSTSSSVGEWLCGTCRICGAREEGGRKERYSWQREHGHKLFASHTRHTKFSPTSTTNCPVTMYTPLLPPHHTWNCCYVRAMHNILSISHYTSRKRVLSCHGAHMQHYVLHIDLFLLQRHKLLAAAVERAHPARGGGLQNNLMTVVRSI